jgi:hypothetical protein
MQKGVPFSARLFLLPRLKFSYWKKLELANEPLKEKIS